MYNRFSEARLLLHHYVVSDIHVKVGIISSIDVWWTQNVITYH